MDTALDLFNDKGLAQVSLRTIADELKISPGNLTYHFKRREEIIETLYYEFVAAVEERFSKSILTEVNLELVYELISILTETRLKYRFLMRDFTSLIAENQALKKHYSSLLKERRLQTQSIFTQLVKQKILRQPELSHEYEYLYDRIQILGNFWITSALMHGEKLTQSVIDRNFEMIWQLLYPYLTEKGKQSWLSLHHFK